MPALGDLNIKLILDVVTADKNAQKINASLKSVETQSNKTKDSMKQAGNSAKEFAGSFGLLELGIAGALLAFGRFTFASLQMGAELTVLRSSFKGTAEDMELFQTATAGNVTEAELIKLSNYASELGLTTDQQAIFLSLAEDVSDKIGGTVAENFQKLTASTEGLTRGLLSLGISTKQFADVQKTLIAETGKTADELTAAEKSAINYKAVLKLTGYTLEDVKNKTMDVGDQMQSLNTFSKDVQASFGTGVASAFSKVYNLSGRLVESLFGVRDGLKAIKDIVPAVGENFVLSLLGPFATAVIRLDEMRNKIADIIAQLSFYGSQTLSDFIRKAPDTAERGSGLPLGEGYVEKDKKKLPGTRTGSNLTKDAKEFLTYLQEINKELAGINDKIAKQSSAESQAEGLFAKKKSLEDEVYLIGQINTGFADYIKLRQQAATLPGAFESSIMLIPEDKMLKFRILLQDQEKANRDTAKTYEGLVSDLSIVDSLISDIGKKLPEGAKSFLSYINSALQVAMQIAQFLKKSNSPEGASFFDFIPVIGTIISGFLGGDSISSSGSGSGFSNWLNGGGSLGSVSSRPSFAGMGSQVVINLNGELTDHLKHKIVSDGNTIVNVRKANSNY
jgi:hypothetical protein